MTPEQEAELGRGIYDREKVHALISAFADSAVELGANFLEVAEAAQAVGTSAMADRADNMVPAGSHIFPACIKPQAWPLTCENATRGHQIGLHGPLSCFGCTRSRLP